MASALGQVSHMRLLPFLCSPHDPLAGRQAQEGERGAQGGHQAADDIPGRALKAAGDVAGQMFRLRGQPPGAASCKIGSAQAVCLTCASVQAGLAAGPEQQQVLLLQAPSGTYMMALETEVAEVCPLEASF